MIDDVVDGCQCLPFGWQFSCAICQLVLAYVLEHLSHVSDLVLRYLDDPVVVVMGWRRSSRPQGNYAGSCNCRMGTMTPCFFNRTSSRFNGAPFLTTPSRFDDRERAGKLAKARCPHPGIQRQTWCGSTLKPKLQMIVLTAAIPQNSQKRRLSSCYRANTMPLKPLDRLQRARAPPMCYLGSREAQLHGQAVLWEPAHRVAACIKEGRMKSQKLDGQVMHFTVTTAHRSP